MMDADDLAMQVRIALEHAGYQAGAILSTNDKADFEIVSPDGRLAATLTLELKGS